MILVAMTSYASFCSCPASLIARLLLSRAEERRRSLAQPSKKTAARKHQAQKTILIQSEGHGVFHIVSSHSHTRVYRHTRKQKVRSSSL